MINRTSGGELGLFPDFDDNLEEARSCSDRGDIMAVVDGAPKVVWRLLLSIRRWMCHRRAASSNDNVTEIVKIDDNIRIGRAAWKY